MLLDAIVGMIYIIRLIKCNIKNKRIVWGYYER